MLGFIVKKIGMTQIFTEEGKALGVTVLKVLDATISQVKTADKDGYTALQVASMSVEGKKLNKPLLGHYTKSKLEPHKYLKEFRTDNVDSFSVGSKLEVNLLEEKDIVDVTGISIGKGFQGVMKRFHFSGGAATHGCSVSHRVPGSIGQGTSPGRVFKNKKMPGQMGNKQVTVRGLEIVKIDQEQSLIMVNGGVPGAKGSISILKNENIEKRYAEQKNDPAPDQEKAA